MRGPDPLPSALAERSLRVDRAAIRAYAEITDDYNPIHVDPDFAARSPMGGIIAHGMLSLNLIWQALYDALPAERCRGAALDIRFQKPVREDDVVTSGGTLREDGRSYDAWVKNQRGETVIAGMVSLAG